MIQRLALPLLAIFLWASVAQAQSPFYSSRNSSYAASRSQLSYNGFRYYKSGSGMTYNSTSGYSGPDYYNFYLYNGPRNFRSSNFYRGPNPAYDYRPGAFSRSSVFGGAPSFGR
ncbi:hypothetical protein [Blastopirellula retiformator]|uniref:Uncharacterized protein n=1 Tax=Blastopirellula retiformator TaxID=2527970 RepID=A0A5C5UV89_9BACT|nr:hypothetical protein [Blastopirellula retiformator]TWT29285.1 hypothetical protein Enr8_50860 [Blastopirellula retiformator]